MNNCNHIFVNISSNIGEILLVLFFIILSLFFFIGSLGFNMEARIFPATVSLLLFIVSLFRLISILLYKEVKRQISKIYPSRSTIITVLSMIVYVILARFIGFLIPSCIFVLILLYGIDLKLTIKDLSIVLLALFVVYVFHYTLRIPLY